MTCSAAYPDRTRPMVTHYDGPESRVELSVASVANAVAKAASMLRDGLGLPPGAVVSVDLPRHWQLPVWVMAGLVRGRHGRPGSVGRGSVGRARDGTGRRAHRRSARARGHRWRVRIRTLMRCWPVRAMRSDCPCPVAFRPESSTSESRCAPIPTSSARSRTRPGWRRCSWTGSACPGRTSRHPRDRAGCPALGRRGHPGVGAAPRGRGPAAAVSGIGGHRHRAGRRTGSPHPRHGVRHRLAAGQ